jgi:hypothetical protein
MTAATNILLRLLRALREAAARRHALPRGTSEYETALREERQAMRELYREAGGTALAEERTEERSIGYRKGRSDPGRRRISA